MFPLEQSLAGEDLDESVPEGIVAERVAARVGGGVDVLQVVGSLPYLRKN